jgi:thymidylate synthase ThyX
MIKTEIIADSLNVNTNDRITTYVLTYPRFIHSELMTHRAFSRNAASSRAIPIEKMISETVKRPAGPIRWTKNQKGMEANEIISDDEWFKADMAVSGLLVKSIDVIRELANLGISKGLANRYLEPFFHITTILTGTEFHNFFAQRCHPAAHLDFQVLAYSMLKDYLASEPEAKEPDEWHIPFDDPNHDLETRLKIATARCARVSYLNHDGEINVNKDLELYTKLVGSEPPHMSPLEHCAMAVNGNSNLGNFKGWRQLRKTLPYENQTKIDLIERWRNRSQIISEILG